MISLYNIHDDLEIFFKLIMSVQKLSVTRIARETLEANDLHRVIHLLRADGILEDRARMSSGVADIIRLELGKHFGDMVTLDDNVISLVDEYCGIEALYKKGHNRRVLTRLDELEILRRSVNAFIYRAIDETKAIPNNGGSVFATALPDIYPRLRDKIRAVLTIANPATKRS